MIHSMTGYGKAEGAGARFHFTVELRSLNSKTFDANFRVPNLLRPYESIIRKRLQESLVRGKVDVSITAVSHETSLGQTIDLAKLEAYLNTFNALLLKTNAKGDPLAAAMRMSDVFTPKDDALSDTEQEELMSFVVEALNHLNAFRSSEGEAMQVDFLSALDLINTLLSAVPEFEQERMERIRAKFDQHFDDLRNEVNRDRLEQEMIYYLEKLDINEEKVRLKQHLTYFREVMLAPVHSGRKLNFIAQEMGREINTLGSKCQHEGIQKLVVDMKDTLEQIKEINLNIA